MDKKSYIRWTGTFIALALAAFIFASGNLLLLVPLTVICVALAIA